MRTRRYLASLSAYASTLIAISIAGAASAATQSADAFYKGKTVEVFVGTATGGGYDSYGRLLAGHIGQYLPGKPNVIVRNMPGASGLALANNLYNQAPRDGSVFAILHNNMTVEPVIGNKNARFDATKFNWIGSANKLVNACVAWHT